MKFFALWCCAALAQWPLARALLGLDPGAGTWPWLAHAAAALILFFAPPKGRGWFSASRPWGQALAFLAWSLPGVGVLAAGGLWLIRGRQERPSKYFEEEPEEEVEQVVLPATGDTEGIWDVLPAVDAMLGSDPTLKRGAIEALVKIRTPEAIGWLLRARKDPQPDVRFYATSALTSMKRDFEQAMKAAEREALEKPMEAGPLLSLVRSGLDYAMSGLLEEATRRELLEKCRDWIAHLAEREDAALTLLYQVERELMSPRALANLDALIGRRPGERSSLLKEKASLMFKLGRYGQTRLLMKEVASLPKPAPAESSLVQEAEDRDWQAAIAWWA